MDCCYFQLIEYVDDLMHTLFEEALLDIQPFWEAWQQVEASVPAYLCSGFERPDKASAVNMHVSRFSK